MATPCIDVCIMGPNGLCRGCLRTLEEIANWSSYPEEKQQQIMMGLEDRAFGDDFEFGE